MATSAELTRELFQKLSASDLDGALAMLADDVRWRVPGKPELSGVGGDYDKKRLGRLFRHMLSQLEGGLAMSVLTLLSEGDRVAAEVESSGDLKNGRKYRQQYHFAINFRDGRVATVHEYLDTHHAWDVWVRP